MGESLYPVSEHVILSARTRSNTTQGEVYTLQFRFDTHYPISSPAVQFVVTDGKEAPVHPVRFDRSILLHPDTEDHHSMSTQMAMCVCLLQIPAIDAGAHHEPQICASILGNEWSPVLSVVAVCVTLQSMLASCKVHVPSSPATKGFSSLNLLAFRKRNGRSTVVHPVDRF